MELFSMIQLLSLIFLTLSNYIIRSKELLSSTLSSRIKKEASHGDIGAFNGVNRGYALHCTVAD
jgi:hypothetical protein